MNIYPICAICNGITQRETSLGCQDYSPAFQVVGYTIPPILGSLMWIYLLRNYGITKLTDKVLLGKDDKVISELVMLYLLGLCVIPEVYTTPSYIASIWAKFLIGFGITGTLGVGLRISEKNALKMKDLVP